MRIARNEKGIALVLVLVLAVIGLAMVSALIFMVTQGTSLSGAMRLYATADEAAVGAAELTAEYITNRGDLPVLTGFAAGAGCDCGISADPDIPASFTDNIDLNTGARSCRCDKICNPTGHYNDGGSTRCIDEDTGTAGLQISVDVNTSLPLTNDGTLLLGPPGNTYTVTYKIVDTVAGNTTTGSIVTPGTLVGEGVVAASGGTYSPPHFPFLYRVEVLAQKTSNPREGARLSMLYAY